MMLLTRLNEDKGITVLMVTHEDEVAAFAKRGMGIGVSRPSASFTATLPSRTTT